MVSLQFYKRMQSVHSNKRENSEKRYQKIPASRFQSRKDPTGILPCPRHENKREFLKGEKIMKKWMDMIEKTDDLMSLTEIIEKAAFDEEISNQEYSELYGIALAKIERF